MEAPWTDGPRELLQHAADHLELGGDFDRRMAMISVDNAVELMVKTWLGLPRRARGSEGPKRKDLEAASESFPSLIDMLDSFASDELSGIDLSDVEWYHRLRNQMYHNGNGITVERSKVETYFQIGVSLFENLFDEIPNVDQSSAINTKAGKFLNLWGRFDNELREQLPPKEGPAYHWKREYLSSISDQAAELYERLVSFRNQLVHGLETPSSKELTRRIDELTELMEILDIPAA